MWSLNLLSRSRDNNVLKHSYYSSFMVVGSIDLQLRLSSRTIGRIQHILTHPESKRHRSYRNHSFGLTIKRIKVQTENAIQVAQSDKKKYADRVASGLTHVAKTLNEKPIQ